MNNSTDSNPSKVIPGRRSLGFAALPAVAALVLTGCVSSTPPLSDVPPVAVEAVQTQPDTPPEPVTEEIENAVAGYWAERDAAFAAGPEAGLAFVVANNHPLLTYTVDDCREAWFDGEIPVGFAERNELLTGSIESDAGWTMVSGPLAGRDLGQGLFNMAVSFNYDGQLLRVADRVANVHLQVNEGEVRHFLMCEDSDVIVASSSTVTGTTAATTTTDATGTTGTTGTTATTPVATTAPVTIPTTPAAPATLPPITATAAPVTGGNGNGDGDGDGGGSGDPTPQPSVSENCSNANGIDFGTGNDVAQGQPGAGDYGVEANCGSIDNSVGQDGGTSEPRQGGLPGN